LHLMESDALRRPITQYPVDGTHSVEKVEFKLQTSTDDHRLGRVHINDTQYFDGVPQAAWDFYIGGYQPAQKWLKDRKGLSLNSDDLRHYQRIISALSLTHQIMQTID
jgi:hypothetical protein